MADPLDLTGDIAEALNGASARGHQLALGYTDDDGYPVVTFRGSAQVYGPERQQDPDRGGVAVIIDVERVQGFRADGPFQQEG